MTAHRKTVVVPVKTGSRDHRHGNQRVLDSIDEGHDGGLLYNNVPIVDAKMLEQSLQDRDLLLVPYVVASYSTFLSLSSGLKKLELVTFSDGDPIDSATSQNVSLSPYNAVMDTAAGRSVVATRRMPIVSPYQRDRRARSLMVTTIPSYDDMLVEVQLDDEDQWYNLIPDRRVNILEGFGALRIKLTLPGATDLEDAKRRLFGMYILYT